MPADERVTTLLAAAEAVLRDQYEPGRHHTGAAVRTAAGETYTAVSLKARTGVADVHAEPVAVARGLLDGHRDFETVTAVKPADEDAWRSGDGVEDGDTRIVSACGQCRELLLAFAPELDIVVAGADGPEVHRLADLPSGL